METWTDFEGGPIFLTLTTGKPLSWVYFAGTLDAAIWGAELELREGPERIYGVKPAGPIVDYLNVADKKFPGNPTLSYRKWEPLRVITDVRKWQGPAPERLQQRRDLARSRAEGGSVEAQCQAFCASATAAVIAARA